MRSRWCIILLITLGTLARLPADVVVFDDSFDLNDGPSNVDVNTNIPNRQNGGTTTSTYTAVVGGNVNNKVRIENNSIGDYMAIRTFSKIGVASTTKLEMDTDFSSSLRGQIYSVHINAEVAFGGAGNDINGSRINFGLAGTANTPGPTNVSTDFTLQLDATGGAFKIYEDGIPVYNGYGTGFTYGQNFNLTFNFDETGSSNVVQVLLQNENGSEQDLGCYEYDIDGGVFFPLLKLGA